MFLEKISYCQVILATEENWRAQLKPGPDRSSTRICFKHGPQGTDMPRI